MYLLTLRKKTGGTNSFISTTLFLLMLLTTTLLSPINSKAQENKSSQPPAGTQQNNGMSSAVYGFGVKTKAEIALEKERKRSIAVMAPLKGQLSHYGTDAVDGAELASDELDAVGGIKGKPYELLVYDTGGSMAGMRNGVDILLRRHILAVVGAATGEVSFAANKAINDNQLIIISAGSRRRLGDTGPYNFRNSLNTGKAVSDLVDYALKVKKWKRFAVFTSLVNDYSIELTAAFKVALSDRGVNFTDELYLWSAAMTNMAQDETSISAQIKKLKKSPPDVLIYTGGAEEAGEVLKELHKQGLNIPLMGSEDLLAPAFTSLGKEAKGTLVYGSFNPNSKRENVSRFVKNFTKRFGHEPSEFSALSYDSYNLLAEAIRNSKSLRPSHVKEALLGIKNFNGVTGRIDVKPSGEMEKKIFVFEMQENGGDYSFISVKDAW